VAFGKAIDLSITVDRHLPCSKFGKEVHEDLGDRHPAREGQLDTPQRGLEEAEKRRDYMRQRKQRSSEEGGGR
jgi:hypothetical protein